MGSEPSLNNVYASLGTTVFSVMSGLAVEHEAINLGQGFPDVDGPEEVRKLAAEHLINGPNQYPPMQGIAELRQAVVDKFKNDNGLAYEVAQTSISTGGKQAIYNLISSRTALTRITGGFLNQGTP